tara:strand:+ start:329 stop:1423 length:1095 start_codon:yes stop_codon:yes gene_type:complete
MTKAAELAKMGEVLTNSQIGGRRNIVINGGMNVAQRGTSQTGITASANEGYTTVDRFAFDGNGHNAVFTATQSTDSPTGFSNSLKMECTTADTSIGASDYLMLQTRFEGQDVQQLKKGTSDAEKVTVSFYVKANASATYMCELQDSDNSRTNGQTFAVTTSWNRIVLTFVGDTTGALDNDNALSFRLNFWFHSGSTYNGGTFTSNQWTGTANERVGSITSFFDSTDRTFFLTGVQLEVGSQATPFEHRSFGEELALCQRYFCQSYAHGTAAGSNQSGTVLRKLASGNGYDDIANFHFPSEMRAVPSISLFNPISGTANGFRGDSANYTGAAINTATTRGVNIYKNASVVATVFMAIHALADAEL